MKKAFCASLPGYDDCGVYFAETASKARYKAFIQARDAGWEVRITDLSVHRAPRYDRVPEADGKAADYAEIILQRGTP